MNEVAAYSATARQIRARLWNPANARQSSELEIVSDAEMRRRRIAQAAAVVEARNAQKDFERRQAVEKALRDAVAERARVMAIARKLVAQEMPPLSIRQILTAVGAYYGFSTIEICSQRRSAVIVLPRQVAMYLCRHFTTCSLPQIAMKIGGRDHTTAMHAVRKIADLIPTDIRLAADIDNIKWELGIR